MIFCRCCGLGIVFQNSGFSMGVCYYVSTKKNIADNFLDLKAAHFQPQDGRSKLQNVTSMLGT